MLEQGIFGGQRLLVPHLLQELASGRRLDVKAADGISSTEQSTGLVIGQGLPATVVDDLAVVLPNGRQGVAYYRQRAVAENVNFYQSCRFSLVLFPLYERPAAG